MKKRYLEDQVKKDLHNKMVFISSPRQVGKTTLAKTVITDDASYLFKEMFSAKSWNCATSGIRIKGRFISALPVTISREFS